MCISKPDVVRGLSTGSSLRATWLAGGGVGCRIGIFVIQEFFSGHRAATN